MPKLFDHIPSPDESSLAKNISVYVALVLVMLLLLPPKFRVPLKNPVKAILPPASTATLLAIWSFEPPKPLAHWHVPTEEYFATKTSYPETLVSGPPGQEPKSRLELRVVVNCPVIMILPLESVATPFE